LGKQLGQLGAHAELQRLGQLRLVHALAEPRA
jgi:hypothetical protein